MKVVAVGSLEGFDVEDLGGKPGVLLTGTMDEIKNAGHLLYEEVLLSKKTTGKRPPAKPPRRLAPPREGE